MLAISRLRLFCALVLLLFLSTSLHAATLNVGSGQPYTTIQSAIDAASPGDTVLVAPGTYSEQITCTKAITVVSSAGPASTFLDGSRVNGFVVTIGTPLALDNSFRAPAILDGFTIQNGSVSNAVFASDGGGITIGGNATVRNNTVLDNYPSGITVRASNALIQNNHILQTVSAVSASHSSTGIAIAPNSVFPYSYIYSPPSLIVTGNVIENNSGNGILDYYATENDPVNSPAFPYLFTYARNVIRNNGPATQTAGILIYAFGGTHVLVDNLVTGNGGTGLLMELAASTNTAPPFQPTGIATNNTIAFNSTSVLPNQGTELSIFGVPQTFTNNLIVHTAVTSVPALYCGGQGSYGLNNTTVITRPNLDHNDLFAPNSPTLTPVSTGCVGTWIANRSEDAIFADPLDGDFHLTASSPEIDAGNNNAPSLPATDLDGKPRIQDGKGTGIPLVDIGAYELGDVNSVAISLASSANPAVYAAPVTLTAQLTSRSGAPTGSVQFSDGPLILAVQPIAATGISTYTTASLAVGTHPILATYQPTGTFTASSATLAQVITGLPTATALTCSPNPVNVFSTALLNASITSANGTPTGTLTFTDNGSILSQSNLANGSASLTYTAKTSGTHSIAATFTPTGAFAGSSASCSELVNTLPTISTITTNLSTLPANMPVILDALVAPANPPGPAEPTGFVSFYSDRGLLGTATYESPARLLVLSLPVGLHFLTCTYSGDSIYAPSSCPAAQVTVTGTSTSLTLTASTNPTIASTPTTFFLRLTAGAQPAAGQTIALAGLAQNPILLTTDSTGAASYIANSLAPGVYPLSATFAATTSLAASSASLPETVLRAPSSVSLSASPNPSSLGRNVTLVATIASSAAAPTGSLAFLDGGSLLANIPITAGRATFTTSLFAVGSHPLTASYAGDANTLPASSAIVQEIILNSDFALSTKPATLTLRTGHHTTFNLSATSIGAFTGQLQFSSSNLPLHATAIITHPVLPLAQGGQATTSVYLDTDDVIGYLSNNCNQPSNSPSTPLLALTVSPFLLLSCFQRRRRLATFLSLLLASIILASAAGCSGKYPASTAPGTYNLQFTAIDPASQNTHAIILTLTVTE